MKSKHIGLAILFATCLWTVPVEATFRAGAAKVDITPPKGIPLGGYSARLGRGNQGFHDRVYAKALVLDDGRHQMVFVTADLIASDLKFHRAIAGARKIDPTMLMLCASHTHSGPGALSNSVVGVIALGAYNPKFYRWLRDKFIDVVAKAQKNLTPAKIAVGIGKLKGRNRNRRRGETITDPQLAVVRVDHQDGRPMGVLFNFSAHGTVLGSKNMLVSADWMGAAQEEVEKRLKGVALYANGAEGDQSPRTGGGKTRFDRCRKMGVVVAQGVEKLYKKLKPTSKVKLAGIGEEFVLPQTVKSPFLGKSKSFLQVLVIGDVAFIGLPGEYTAPLGLEIKKKIRKLGYRDAVAMGLANDHLGYVLTPQQFDRGGYEAETSFYGRTFGPQTAAILVRLAGQLKEATSKR